MHRDRPARSSLKTPPLQFRAANGQQAALQLVEERSSDEAATLDTGCCVQRFDLALVLQDANQRCLHGRSKSLVGRLWV
jgi:hypothetical protein